MAPNSHRQNDSLLNLPIQLRNESGLKLARSVTYILVAAVAILIGWAAIAPVEEIAVATGKVIPTFAISDVHHLEGGIVEKVFVAEGDQVKRGQVLIQLRPQQASGDLSQLQARVANLRIKRERLTASLTGRELNFGTIGESYPKLRDEYRQAFERDNTQAREERQQLELAIQRIRGQLRSAEGEKQSLITQVELLTDQAGIREKSNARGYTSKHTLLQARANLEQARQHLITANGRSAELAKLLEEAQTKLRETVAERMRKLAEDRAGVAAELAEAEETLEKYRDRVERLQVISPIDGLVQSLVNHLSGEVVKPGAVIAQIVPAHGGVIAEVELQPRDIGHVRVGNSAEIKLTNYDPNVVGIIKGRVELISATTFEDKEGHPFYRVRIAMDRDRLRIADLALPISPGTTLDAQILTGSKTLLRYMLKPVYQSFETAFSER